MLINIIYLIIFLLLFSHNLKTTISSLSTFNIFLQPSGSSVLFYKLLIFLSLITLLKSNPFYKLLIPIPALYKCQNLPYSNEYGTEFLKPTAITVGFSYIPFSTTLVFPTRTVSSHLFFLNPYFPHLKFYTCLQSRLRQQASVDLFHQCCVQFTPQHGTITFSQNHTQSKGIDFVQYSHTLFPI